MNKVIYVKNSDLKRFNDIKSEMNVKNNLLYYTVAAIFNLSNLAKTNMSHEERCFLMITETNNFLELDFALVKKILQFSKLHITSELEVFYAINDWISYKLEERINLAKYLLLTIRLPLLSDAALKYIKNETFTVSKVDECKRIINGVLFKNDEVLNILPKKSFDVRYCDQDSFNVLLCKRKGSIKHMNGKNFEEVRSTISNILISKYEFVAAGVFLKDEIYVFVRSDANDSVKVKKLSKISKDWENVLFLKDRIDFCACALIDKIFIFGGEDKNRNTLNSCTQFDTKNNKIKDIAKMKHVRKNAASTVYKGKIVVSGGEVQNGFGIQLIVRTNTVEIYDHIANEWSTFPNMNEERSDHSLVAIKSKLFVIGSRNYENYDEVTNVFTLIKVPLNFTSFCSNVRAISIGNKIAFVRGFESRILFLDTGNDKWCEKVIDLSDPNYFSFFLKVPQM